jgi:hypothetical protein
MMLSLLRAGRDPTYLKDDERQPLFAFPPAFFFKSAGVAFCPSSFFIAGAEEFNSAPCCGRLF